MAAVWTSGPRSSRQGGVLGAGDVVLLANLIALVPARMAARTRPAIVLRTE